MKKTLLKFTSLMYLIAFRKFSKAKYWEINLQDLTVVCDCSEKEAMFAYSDFLAVTVQSPDELASLNNIGEVTLSPVAYRLSS